MHHITMYTDGSAIGNPGPGGWAVLLQSNGHERLIAGGCPEMTTNNRMELTALLKGLQALRSPCHVTVVTDSEYVCGILSLGWTRKANHDLLTEVDQSLSIHRVSFQVVRAHSGHPENERVDAAARTEAERAKGASPVVAPQAPNDTLTPYPCVNCGTPGQTGRYGTLPVCVPCYTSGRLLDFLQATEAPVDSTSPPNLLLRDARVAALTNTLHALVNDLLAQRIHLEDFDQDLLTRLSGLLTPRSCTPHPTG